MRLLDPRIRRYWVYRVLHTRSIPLTRRIARRYGEQFGFVYVGGYPKSGTTWVSQLVSDVLDIPFPKDYALPLAFRCLVHHHWRHEPFLDRSVYVIRDGRDVMVSEFVSMMHGAQAMRERAARFGTLSLVERAMLYRFGRDARLLRRMDRVFGRGFDPLDVQRNLPLFIEADMQQPLSEVVAEPWPRHVRRWIDAGQRTVFVRYEDLLEDGPATLTRAVSRLLGQEADPVSIARGLDRYAFERRSGRQPGTEQTSSFLRKGISGDWRNYFTREACRVFDHHAGDMLIELGYESDRSWVDTFDDAR